MPEDRERKHISNINYIEDFIGADIPNDQVRVAISDLELDELITIINDSNGNEIDPLNQDALQSVAKDELRSRIHDSSGTQIDPLNQDALQDVSNDELRSRLFGPNSADDATNQAVIELLNTAISSDDTALLTYISRALNSVGEDEIVSRISDSTSSQIDPLNQDALDSVSNDELRSLLLGTDTGGADQKVIAEQLDTEVDNTDVAILTWLARALNDIGLDELVTRVTDSTGNQVDPATNDDQPNYFDEDIVSHDLIGTGDYTIQETNVRGTGDIIVKVNSSDSNTFTVTLEWTDGAGTVLYSQSAAEGTDVTDANLKFKVGSNNFQLNITDTSGAAQNNINGTVNVH